MKLFPTLASSIVAVFASAAASQGVPAKTFQMKEIDLINLRLEGIREKCLVEELPEHTVLLVKHSASAWSKSKNQLSADQNISLMTTVRDPSGHTISRNQSQGSDRLFITSTVSGSYLVCFQVVLKKYSPDTLIKLGLEVFIGDAGDHRITSPIEAEIGDLAHHISEALEKVSDLQREQTLQRERESSFRAASDRVSGRVYLWAFLQSLIILITSAFQLSHLKKFFKYKKLV